MNDRVAGRFTSGLLNRLADLDVDDAEAAAHIDGLRGAVRDGGLSRNAVDAGGVEPGWLKPHFFDAAGGWGDEPLLGAMHDMFSACRWIYAHDFYPEPEHRHFSGRVVGATLAGEADAVYDSQQRYIALLIAIEPGTTYPLHAHRIEETYLVLAGEAEWSHDGERWARLGPGGSFHNRSWQAHTMRTGRRGMLSLGLYLPPFGWEGGLL